MRCPILLLLLIFCACVHSYALIGIGISYKNVLFWRFWEIKDGKPVPEMIVYNTGDTAISFTMRKTYVEAGCTPSGTSKEEYEKRSAAYAKDTVVKTTKILPHQYAVFMVERGQHGEGYNGAFVNGKYAGIVSGMQDPTKELAGRYEFKYYSYEGMYGTPGWGLIATNSLFTKRGEEGMMYVYYCFWDKDKWQFFSGISDMSATINGGLDGAALDMGKNFCLLNTSKRTQRFAVNMDKTQPYKMRISFKIADNSEFPSMDMQYFFQNGNAGIELPIFVQ